MTTKDVAMRNNRLKAELQTPSFEVVDGDFFHVRFYALGDEFEVLRVNLIIVLRLLAGEGGVQRDLIGLVHNGAGAADHLADVEKCEAGDGFKKFVGAGDDGIGGLGLRGVGPENDNVGEHNFNLRRISTGTRIRASKELSGHACRVGCGVKL